MSDIDVTVDLRNQRAINPNDLPFIEWERIENPGLGVGHGEKKVVQKVVLCDPKGSPFVWVDQNYVTYTMQKGWKIVGFGNFDKLRRHDGTPHQQLEDIRPLVEGRADLHREMEVVRAENEKLKAERAHLIAERAAIPAPSIEGDFRTEDEKNAGLVSVVLDKDVPTGPTALETSSATTLTGSHPDTAPAVTEAAGTPTGIAPKNGKAK